MWRDHANLVEAVRVQTGGEKFERIDGSVSSLVNGMGEVFQEVPDSVMDTGIPILIILHRHVLCSPITPSHLVLL